jgi:hypothetical protein
MMNISIDIPTVCMVAAVSVCVVTRMMMRIEARDDYRPQRGPLVALGALGAFFLTLTVAGSLITTW